MINAQEWLNQEYPTKESKEQITSLYLNNHKLEGELDLSEFINLEDLTLNNKQVTTLNLTKNTKLRELDVSFCNQLTTIQGLENCPYLKEIYADQCSNLQPPYTFLEAWKQEIAQLKAQIQEYENQQQKITELEQNLTNLHSQNQTLTQENHTLQDQAEDQKQRILALEADKQDLIHQLTQAKEIYQNHLTQEKSHLTKEIQLIKEVIYV